MMSWSNLFRLAFFILIFRNEARAGQRKLSEKRIVIVVNKKLTIIK